MPRAALVTDTKRRRPQKPKTKEPTALDPELRLLSITEVAAHLGVNQRSVRRFVHRGTFPKGIVVGRFLRWRYSDVLDWIESQRPATRASPP